MKTFYPLISVVVLALFLRMMGLLSRPIWYDEAFAIIFSTKGPAAMLYGTVTSGEGGAADIHPLGYYTLLWVWLGLFGNSVSIARLLSIFINLLSLGLVYKIAGRLFDRNTALVAAILFAILPAQVHYAQEIRMYALLALCLLTATYAFLRARAGNWKWWILFSVSSALAQYTHNLAAFYLVPLAFTPVFQRDWKTLWALIVSGFAALALYAPWMIYLPSQFAKVNSFYWVERPGVERLFSLLLFFLPHLPLFGLMLAIGLLCAMLIISLAGFQTHLASKSTPTTVSKGLWTAYMSFVPPLSLWLFSQKFPVYIERALLPSQTIFCIWLAWSFTQTRPPKVIQYIAGILVATCAIIGFCEHLTYNGFPYAPFHELNQSIAPRLESGDIIVHSNKLSYLPGFYFDPTLPQVFIFDPTGSAADTLAPATGQVLEITGYPSIESATKDAKRIWFIIYRSSIDEYEDRGQMQPHFEYLEENFKRESVENWNDLRLYIYSRKMP